MLKKDMLNQIDFDSLIQINFDIKLIRNNKYFTKKDFVKALSRRLTSDEIQHIIDLYKKNTSLNKISKSYLTWYKPTGEFIRNKFIKNLINKEIKGKIRNDVIFFEFPIQNKRTDISRINGYSYAYEIKSSRDDISRSIEQTNEFLSVFEYVYLIVEEMNEIDLNDNVGIIKYYNDDGIIDFNCIKKPRRLNSFNSTMQLSLLQKTELKHICNRYGFSNSITRNDSEQSILKNFDEKAINNIFKHYVKKRYKSQWLKTIKYFSS